MGIDEPTPARDQLNPRFLEKTQMKFIQTVHFRPHIAEQLADIGLNRIAMQSVGRGILQLMTGLRSINEQFLGDTAADDTGAADAITLHNGHIGSMTCRPFGGGQPPGTGTEHHKIKRLVHRS